MAKIIKTDLNGDLRRITLTDSFSYRDLLKNLADIYHIDTKDYTIKYTDDDDDKVTISSEVEFVEALRLNASTLRITISKTSDEGVKAAASGGNSKTDNNKDTSKDFSYHNFDEDAEDNDDSSDDDYSLIHDEDNKNKDNNNNNNNNNNNPYEEIGIETTKPNKKPSKHADDYVDIDTREEKKKKTNATKC